MNWNGHENQMKFGVSRLDMVSGGVAPSCPPVTMAYLMALVKTDSIIPPGRHRLRCTGLGTARVPEFVIAIEMI